MTAGMRVALVYDMDACLWPTGVTRHALAQIKGLAAAPRRRPDPRLRQDRRARRPGLLGIAGRPPPPGIAPADPRRSCGPGGSSPGRPLELWTGAIDWAYSPAEYFVPTRKARRALTSHDVLQDLRFSPPSRRRSLAARLRGGRPDPVRLALQHRSSWSKPSPTAATRSRLPQRRGRPVLRAADGPRARRRPGRPGPARRDALSALGRELPAEEEPREARPRRRPSAGSRLGRPGPVLLGAGSQAEANALRARSRPW